ncbi:MAG: PilZ domain-containing protein [Candidatus Zapsychrus exili]|nr:PilZ domain-containing protein [Candidatus Zapsychrus exili]
MNERRRDPRLDDNIPIKLSQEDGDVVTETGNISRSGAYCRVNKYIEPMTKLKVSLIVPIRKSGKEVTKKISCNGVVVRTESRAEKDSYNIAIFFNDISQRDSENISDYVSSCLDNEC